MRLPAFLRGSVIRRPVCRTQIHMPTERSRDFVTVDPDGAACSAATLAPPRLPHEVYPNVFEEHERCRSNSPFEASYDLHRVVPIGSPNHFPVIAGRQCTHWQQKRLVYQERSVASLQAGQRIYSSYLLQIFGSSSRQELSRPLKNSG